MTDVCTSDLKPLRKPHVPGACFVVCRDGAPKDKVPALESQWFGVRPTVVGRRIVGFVMSTQLIAPTSINLDTMAAAGLHGNPLRDGSCDGEIGLCFNGFM